MNLRYDLIVFDWDGTLMDSEAKIERCLSAAAQDVGVAAPRAGTIRHVPVLGFEEIVQSLYGREDVHVRTQLAHHFRLCGARPGGARRQRARAGGGHGQRPAGARGDARADRARASFHGYSLFR